MCVATKASVWVAASTEERVAKVAQTGVLVNKKWGGRMFSSQRGICRVTGEGSMRVVGEGDKGGKCTEILYRGCWKWLLLLDVNLASTNVI
jgi:hypothetical protein